MELNIPIHLVAALIPMIIGFLWYNPKTFEPAWKKVAGVTDEQIKSGNMPLIFGLSFILSFFMTILLNYFVHHEMGLEAIFRPIEAEGLGLDEASETGVMLKGLIAEYETRFSTFGHGAFHGLIISIFLILPVMATRSMFERKSWKYIFINWAYWTVTLALMGGVLCQWA